MNYLNLQSIVNYRIPIKDDGSLGNPEIISKWTKEMGAVKKKKPKKVKSKTVIKKATVQQMRSL